MPAVTQERVDRTATLLPLDPGVLLASCMDPGVLAVTQERVGSTATLLLTTQECSSRVAWTLECLLVLGTSGQHCRASSHDPWVPPVFFIDPKVLPTTKAQVGSTIKKVIPHSRLS